MNREILLKSSVWNVELMLLNMNGMTVKMNLWLIIPIILEYYLVPIVEVKKSGGMYLSDKLDITLDIREKGLLQLGVDITDVIYQWILLDCLDINKQFKGEQVHISLSEAEILRDWLNEVLKESADQ